MEPTRELIGRLHRDKGESADQMTFEQRFLAGAELFDYACEITKSGIRMQNPSFDEAQVNAELGRRLLMADRLREAT